MKKNRGRSAARRILALCAMLSTLFTVHVVAAREPMPTSTASTGQIALEIIKSQLPLHEKESKENQLSFFTSLLLQDNATFMANRANRSSLPDMPPVSDSTMDSENSEGTLIDPSTEKDAPSHSVQAEDNGVAAKTIHPTNPEGYLVWKDVYISNSSKHAPDLSALMQTRPAAVFTDEMPQVLILHTHGTEAYTMPKGKEYNESGETRTTDTAYNVVRVGDEIATVLEQQGISVLHDRTMYDAAGYNDSYERAGEAIAAHLQKYPSIRFVIDVHRDAIEDSAGTPYKVITSEEGQTAAQLALVIGTNGSGLSHDHWQENLKFAVLLQQSLIEKHPTLMRPMYLRNARYNEHATTGSILLEVGAAGNSLDEALCAARLFAEGASQVLKGLR